MRRPSPTEGDARESTDSYNPSSAANREWLDGQHNKDIAGLLDRIARLESRVRWLERPWWRRTAWRIATKGD